MDLIRIQCNPLVLTISTIVREARIERITKEGLEQHINCRSMNSSLHEMGMIKN